MVGPASWTADDRRLLGKMLLWSGALIALLTALQEWPLLAAAPKVLLHPSPWRAVYLAPQALSITLTIGAALGLVLTVGGRRISSRLVLAVCVLACAASIASFVNIGWIVPASKQAYRVLMSGGPSGAPEIQEMTFGELTGKIHSLTADPALAHNGFSSALIFNYHMRWALAASPLVYALLVLSLGSLMRRRWLLAVITCVSFFGYFALLNLLLPWNSGLPPAAAAWSSNACLLGVAATAAAGLIRMNRRGARAVAG